MALDPQANPRYAKAPELAQWATEGEGDGRAYVDPFDDPKLKKRYPSVTTVLKKEDKSALIQWSVDQIVETVIDRWQDMGKDPDWIRKWLRFAHNDVRDLRAWVGSGLHAAVDADVKDEWFSHTLNHEQQAMLAQWHAAKASLMMKPVLSEFTVKIGETMGTGDLLVWISEDFGVTWELLLIDVKTSKNIWPGHKMQVAKLMQAEYYFEKVPAGTPGAKLHKYTDSVTKKSIKTWWLRKPAIQPEGGAILHIREDSWELVRLKNVEVHVRKFDHYRGLWEDDKKLKELGD